ncbi:YciI family protein [Nocardia sp. JCM 34519.1]|uniref:YciI family protein n=1 Tax=unclassified Nocardia TaxID=2637762 RepID=UPI0035A8FD76
MSTVTDPRSGMKQYLLGIYQPEGATPPDNLDEIMREVDAFNADLRAAGKWVFAAGLHGPDTATVLRANSGEVLVTDGPYLESKEYIAGFSIIRAEDLDEALTWGRRLATILGALPVEVRPLVDE